MKETAKKQFSSHKHGKAEIIVFFCYIIGISIIGYYHEPWFDEAQAWMIARCASVKELIFEVEHYEGHPPLWHLLLMPFAKAGAPFELTIFLINAVFCVSAIALLLWKSPLPKIVRCWIPFTFFYFYQYGVITRPYSMMMLAFCILAIYHPQRNQKPICYILAMSFLCLTSAYGIVIAGGLCLVWVFEIIAEYRKTGKYKTVIRDSRPYALFCILLLALFLLFCMLPAEDCYFDQRNTSFLTKLSRIWYLLILPCESFIGCYVGNDEVFNTFTGCLLEIVGGIFFWAVILLFLHQNRKKAMFLVPYLLYGIISPILFMATHHFGISALFMVFALWVIYAENGTLQIPPFFYIFSEKISSNIIRILIKCVMLLAAVISPLCSLVSSINDIRYNYGLSCVADFIKEQNIADKKIMISWNYELVKPETKGILSDNVFDETLPAEFPEITMHHPYLNGISAAVLPYFDKNIIMNFNADDPDCLYMKWIDGGDHEKIYSLWEEKGLPDFIFGSVPLQEIYSPEELEGVTYYWVETLEYGDIWKLTRTESEIKVYIRSDLLDEYPQFEVQKYATILTEPIK